MTDIFAGFDEPQENWSKLPHSLIGALPLISSLAEMKVILYVLRHTWGYQDHDKKISIDEFVSGRKCRDGSRIDSGTGMSENAVRDGIERAVAHGFLTVTTDDSDKARVKKYYSLRVRGAEVEPLALKSCTSEPQELNPWPSKVAPRSEKETTERNSEKETRESGAADAAPAPQEDEPTVMELFLESKRQESGRCPWCGGNVTRPGKDWPASLECPDCGVELLVSFQDGSPPKNPKRRQEDAEARGFVRKFNRGMEYTFASAIGRGDIVSANRLLGKGYTVAQAVECAQWIRAKKPQLGGHPNLGLVVRLWDEWRAAQERQPEVSDYARQLSEGEAI